MAHRTRDITYFYPKPWDTGYGSEVTEKRFSVLRQLDFSSVLDVGSGRCNLHQWLKDNGYEVKYDAVDIREDALLMCQCETFTEIPDREYDLVCLFGTVTFNIGEDSRANAHTLTRLLARAREVSTKHILFTVMKRENLKGLAAFQLVGFTREETEGMAGALGSFVIDDTTDPDEYIVTVTKE